MNMSSETTCLPSRYGEFESVSIVTDFVIRNDIKLNMHMQIKHRFVIINEVKFNMDLHINYRYDHRELEAPSFLNHELKHYDLLRSNPIFIELCKYNETDLWDWDAVDVINNKLETSFTDDELLEIRCELPEIVYCAQEAIFKEKNLILN